MLWSGSEPPDSCLTECVAESHNLGSLRGKTSSKSCSRQFQQLLHIGHYFTVVKRIVRTARVGGDAWEYDRIGRKSWGDGSPRWCRWALEAFFLPLLANPFSARRTASQIRHSRWAFSCLRHEHHGTRAIDERSSRYAQVAQHGQTAGLAYSWSESWELRRNHTPGTSSWDEAYWQCSFGPLADPPSPILFTLAIRLHTRPKHVLVQPQFQFQFQISVFNFKNFQNFSIFNFQ